MTPAALLLGYALLLAEVAAPLLRRAGWVDRAPRLGIAAWQALTTATLSAAVLAGAVPVVSHVVSCGARLAVVLDACVLALRAQYMMPGGPLVVVLGGTLALAVTVRVAYCLLAGLVVAGRQRRHHRDMLVLIGRRDPDLEAFVVDHNRATAYCLPGRDRDVVLTSAALDALNEGQLRAVLAHERAHLRERHHLVLAAAQALERAIPGVALFANARAEIDRLVEMAADDVASRGNQRRTVATALVTLAEGPHPVGALTASGAAVVARVGRLLAAPSPLGSRGTTLGFAAVVLLLVAPLAIAAGPAVAVAQLTAACPLDPVSCLP